MVILKRIQGLQHRLVYVSKEDLLNVVIEIATVTA